MPLVWTLSPYVHKDLRSQKIMGHEDGKTTPGYAHADTAEIETVVAVLPRVMGQAGVEL